MGLPEKRSNDPLNQDDFETPKVEILSDLDDYQEKIETQWESAKASYQEKVNKILDEFIQQNVRATPVEPAASSAPELDPLPGESTGPVTPPLEKESDAQARLERLLSRAEKVLRKADKKDHLLPPVFETKRFELGWHGEPKLIRWLKKSWPWLAGAVVLMGIIGLFFRTPSSQILPYGHATGILVSNNKLYVVDWFRKMLFVHDIKRGFPIIAVENIPNQFITGYTKTNTKMFTLDGLTHEFLEHSLTPEHLVTARYDAPGKKPAGLYFDGSDLWSMDDETKMLYRHHSNDVEDIKAQYRLPDMTVSGVVVRKNKVWILSEKARLIKEFRLEDPVRELATFDLDPFLQGATATSFTINKNDIWMTTENPTQLLRIPLRKIR